DDRRRRRLAPRRPRPRLGAPVRLPPPIPRLDPIHLPPPLPRPPPPLTAERVVLGVQDRSPGYGRAVSRLLSRGRLVAHARTCSFHSCAHDPRHRREAARAGGAAD